MTGWRGDKGTKLFCRAHTEKGDTALAHVMRRKASTQPRLLCVLLCITFTSRPQWLFVAVHRLAFARLQPQFFYWEIICPGPFQKSGTFGFSQCCGLWDGGPFQPVLWSLGWGPFCEVILHVIPK